jgi:hypothetical protein
MKEGFGARKLAAVSLANRSHGRALGAMQSRIESVQVSTFCFGAYIFFLLDFFLRFPARIPGYGSIRPTVVELGLISLLLFVQKDKLKGRADDPIFKAILVLIAYIVITIPFVEWPGSVLRVNAKDFVSAIVFFIFTALIVDSEKRLKITVGVFLACQLFRVFEPLFLNLTTGYMGSATHLGGGDFAGRLSGAPADVINPNELGFVIVTAIPFLHYLLLPRGWKGMLLYGLLLAPMLYALILTMSRGAFIALLVVAWMVFKESKRKWLLLLVVPVIAAIGWSTMSPLQKDRYLSLIDGDTTGGASVEGRLQGMVNEFKLGLNRPIVGHGVGTTPEAKVNVMGGRRQASHNLYAELLIEIGSIGAILFLRYLFAIYRRFRSNVEAVSRLGLRRSDFFFGLNKIFVALFWMYAVYSLNYWGLSQYYWYFFGGLVLVYGRLLQKRAEMNEQLSPETVPTRPLSNVVRPGG